MYPFIMLHLSSSHQKKWVEEVTGGNLLEKTLSASSESVLTPMVAPLRSPPPAPGYSTSTGGTAPQRPHGYGIDALMYMVFLFLVGG